MTADRQDRRIFDLLTELSLPAVPDYIDDTLRRTARTRQRPGWTFPERWLPMDTILRAPAGVRQPPWRAIATLALLGLLLAIAIVVSGSRPNRLPTSYGLAANGALLYDRAGDILIADAASKNERVLVGGPTEDFAATWARDGTRFFFARRTIAERLVVMAADADGRNVQQVSEVVLASPGDYDLSPASDELAVIDAASGARKLSLLSLTGDGQLRDLHVGTIDPAGFVAWRPGTSNELLFTGHPGGDPTQLGLYAIHPDGTGLRELVLQRGESVPTASPATQYSFQDVSLSADGVMAMYWNWETTVESGHSCFIHALNLATGQDRRLTIDPSADCEMLPQLRPDGRSFVAESGRLDGTSQLFVAPIDAGTAGASMRRFGPAYSYTAREGFAISPDGTRVIFVPVGEAGREIVIATGEVIPTAIEFYVIPSWQRLAP